MAKQDLENRSVTPERGVKEDLIRYDASLAYARHKIGTDSVVIKWGLMSRAYFERQGLKYKA